MFEEIAKLKDIILTTKDYEKLDSLMLYEKFRKSYTLKLEKKDKKINLILAKLLFLWLFFPDFNLKSLQEDVDFIKRLKEVDLILRNYFLNYQESLKM